MRPFAAALTLADVEGGAPESRLQLAGIDFVHRLVLAGCVLAHQIVSRSLGPSSICEAKCQSPQISESKATTTTTQNNVNNNEKERDGQRICCCHIDSRPECKLRIKIVEPNQRNQTGLLGFG